MKLLRYYFRVITCLCVNKNFTCTSLRASLHHSFWPRDDFRPGMNSSRYLVVILLLFTRFRPRMTSSRDDFIPVLSTGMKCHPTMKSGEKCQVKGLPGMKVPCVKSGCETWARSRDPRTKTLL